MSKDKIIESTANAIQSLVPETAKQTDHGIAINNYGQSFAQVCMNKGEF